MPKALSVAHHALRGLCLPEGARDGLRRMRLGKVGADNYGKANKNPGEKNAESEGLCVALALGTPGRAAGTALVEDQERSLNLDCGRSVAVGA